MKKNMNIEREYNFRGLAGVHFTVKPIQYKR